MVYAAGHPKSQNIILHYIILHYITLFIGVASPLYFATCTVYTNRQNRRSPRRCGTRSGSPQIFTTRGQWISVHHPTYLACSNWLWTRECQESFSDYRSLKDINIVEDEKPLTFKLPIHHGTKCIPLQNSYTYCPKPRRSLPQGQIDYHPNDKMTG